MEKSTTPYALVVDDDALILMHACNILEDAGFRCFDASDGQAAVKMLDGHAASIILLFSDVEMPGGIDGFELARHVAGNWPHIEIVIASGRITPQPGDMPERATFVAKPFSTQMVHDHLRATLPDGKKPEPLKTAV
ncbi:MULTISPECIES: response regulator transcription factor [unclassified Sphingobium]|uniref:response regulator transcription factor n=1 Tax=unclassified Sphingobium TaxID=2611147 RepID=UPI0022241936|nr:MULTISPECIES: response regulator [unclassified Sphingobium]MCW2410871.1 CheY-like chemotaxis protein [Sphingobium sp. B8D3D]MCW2416839.1 CheY-like chemotaxis protein [Sphingobium sp. B8D3A]